MIRSTPERDRKIAEIMGKLVLYEDNHVLAFDKPAGVLSQAAGPGDDNMLDRVRAYLKVRYDKPGNVFVGLVHRLDRNVSGAMLFARTSKAASRLSAAFKERRVDKRYLALVQGRIAEEEGELVHRLSPNPRGRGVVEHPEGSRARLGYRRLEVRDGMSLLEVALHSGRKHQIRAQLAFCGRPIVGDPLYGTPHRTIRRPALHASRLGLVHPVRRTDLVVRAALPGDLRSFIDRLGFDTGDY